MQEEKFLGFSLGAVVAEYEKLAASCGADKAEEKGQYDQIEKKGERPKRLGMAWWALFGNSLIIGILVNVFIVNSRGRWSPPRPSCVCV